MKKFLLIFLTLFFFYVSNSQNYWMPKANLPGSPRYASVGFSIDSTGYIVGGQVSSSSYTNEMWALNPFTNTWVQKANFPGGSLYGLTAFVINGIAYVGNGHFINGTNTNNYYKYDPSTNTWTSVASFPGSARYGCGFFVLNGKGYVFGGTTGSVYLKDLYEYDPMTNSWSQKASLPGNERAHPVCFAVNGKGYVTTGKKAVGVYLNDTWEYDPATNTWSQKGNIANFGRTVAAGFTINGKGYCGSGVDTSGSELKDFWEYDPATGQWTQVATIDEATGRHGASSFSIFNRGYILTGLHGSTYMKDVWEYFPNNSGVGIAKQKEASFSVFPNPTTGMIYFSINQNSKIKRLEIYDQLGKKVLFAKDISSNALDLSSLDNGLYFMKIFIDNKVVVKKIQVER